MEAEELRIGNCITSNGEVIEFSAHDLVDMNLFYPEPNKDRQPIPLTEEWLLKLGFELNKHGNYVMDYNDGINGDNTIVVTKKIYNSGEKVGKTAFYGVLVQSFILDSVPLCTVEYVHQLQNLFYSLCGKELEISNPIFSKTGENENKIIN